MIHDEAGFSLVELLVAALLIGIAVMPLLQFVPGTLAPIQVSDTELRLSAVATRRNEEIINQLRSNINSVSTGSQVCSDVPNCRVQWTIATEQSSAVNGVGSLKTIATIACRDVNANGTCDSTEDQVRYDTKVTSRP
jgi:prepilin-type N-terminal cleavage/methylation domain-containing protein